MNPQHYFRPKRPRSPTGGVELVPLSSSYPFSHSDVTYNSQFFDPRSSFDQVAPAYGSSSGFEPHSYLQENGILTKRRKLIPMPPSELREKPALPGPHYQERHVQLIQDPNWLEVRVPSSNPPFAKRLFDLGCIYICKSCDGPTDVYQQLPQAPPPVLYGPPRPYVGERPPSLQIPSPESYQAPSIGLDQQHAYTSVHPTGLTSPPIYGHLVLPNQVPFLPPAINDPSGHQTGMPADYVAHPPKHDSAIGNGHIVYTDRPIPQNPSSLSFGPVQLDLTTPIPSHPIMAPMTTLEVPHYSGIPCERPAEIVPQNAWSVVPVACQQPILDIAASNSKVGKRGAFKTPEEREQTAFTRKIGSCLRCKSQRIRCNLNVKNFSDPCLTCLNSSTWRTENLPCLRYRLSDVKLFKPGQVSGYEWTRRWKNNISDQIHEWASTETKIIRFSEGLSDKFVEFEVRRFVPQEGDKLVRTWVHQGETKSVSIPPYALVNFEAAKKDYNAYIDKTMGDAFGTLLGDSTSLLYKTYLMAWKMFKHQSTSAEDAHLLQCTFKLWMAIRLSTRSGFIVGEETLGMPTNILDDTHPNHGRIPVPPVLGAQTDVILIHHIQTKLRKDLLDRLHKMFQVKGQKNWFVTYLVIFILLHNTSLITKHDAGYARKHGMKRRFAREDKVTEYHLGANILLAHFHFCNNNVIPFSEGCKDQDMRNLAGLDEAQIEFVKVIRTYATQQKQDWEELRNSDAYDNDYFYICQLFEENWRPRSIIIDNRDG